MKSIIRIGFIGAGGNTRDKHLPLFAKIPGVELAAVCNRSLESAQKVADNFGITKACKHWQDIINDPEIDAICIGTWPDMHELLSVEALKAGKHVLCEARMARTASEAKNMLQISRLHSQQISQVVPSPFTLRFDDSIQQLVKDGFFGQILSINGRFNFTHFLNSDNEMTWRENADISGFNTMLMGIMYEAIARWVGHAKSLMASSKTFTQFKNFEGQSRAVDVPEHIDILSDMYCGAQMHLQFSSLTGLEENNESIWIFGSEGTAHLDLRRDALFVGRKGDKKLSQHSCNLLGNKSWRVEEEFINAIRGDEEVQLTSFQEAYKYMEFTEAVAKSCRLDRRIHLPLELN